MERRDFLKIFSAASVAAMSGQMAMRAPISNPSVSTLANTYEDIDTNALELAQSIQYMTTPAPNSAEIL